MERMLIRNVAHWYALRNLSLVLVLLTKISEWVEHISGVILFSETLHAFNLAPLLISRSIIPGIRADTDSQPLPISTLEPATQGLDDLLPRLLKAHAAGARFAKWRAPILCDEHKYPTQAALEVQAESLARFASIAQQAGLVPIVEPDVDYSADASLAKSVDVHVRIVSMIYARCLAYGLLTEGEYPYLFIVQNSSDVTYVRYSHQTIVRSTGS